LLFILPQLPRSDVNFIAQLEVAPRNLPQALMSSTRISLALLASLIALVSFYLWPTLNLHHFFAYGDNAVHGLPLAKLHHDILHYGESALWSPLIYGGHPIFAESQGAFANPVNIVLNTLFKPVTVSILLHWVGMVMSVTGMFALCRVLDLSPMASAFAALAAVFSPFWLGIHSNAVVMAAVGWVPWMLYTFELWLKRPGLPTALLFGACTAMLILPGYPHLLYTAAIYMATSLLPTLIHTAKNAQRLSRGRALWFSGFLAVIVTIGLAAVQLLPTFELIGESHRNNGVQFPWFVWPIVIERGMLFWTNDTATSSSLLPLLGSTMVCILAAAAVFLTPRHRIIGIALATFLLGHLSSGFASAIFTFIYTRNLIPGLHQFRIMSPFFLPALIGISVLAAATIDDVTRRLQQSHSPSSSSSKLAWITAIGGATVAALLLIYATYVYEAPISLLFFVTAGVTLLAPLLLKIIRRGAWLAPLLLLLLLTEIMAIKLIRPNYQPVSLIKSPDIVTQIPPAQRRDYKFLDLVGTGSALALSPDSPRVPAWYQRVQAAVGPSTNLLWNVPSLEGAFALNLTRHALPQAYMRQEAIGEIRRRPGLRMIDLLGLRYLSAPVPLSTEGFTLLKQDNEMSLYFYRNDFAAPRFQVYDSAIAVKDLEADFEALKQLDQRTLVIESDDKTLRDLTGDTARINQPPSAAAELTPATTAAVQALTFKALKTASDHYAFEVDAARGGWLFIADNMYPGWHALLDDKPTPLFAAQVMGKAVWVPAGKHRVEVIFTSRSFQIGLAITLVTLCIVLYLAVVAAQGRHMMHKLNQNTR